MWGIKLENWYIKNRSKEAKIIADKFNISLLKSRLLVNRGIKEKEDIKSFINCSLAELENPFRLKDMDEAVNLIEKHLINGKIKIVGDYDVDGVFSSYILLKGLENLGGNVIYEIPDRIEDGYGINKKIIDRALKEEVSLIITCDNGISAVEEVSYARKKGLDIIVTDHHDLPFKEKNGKNIPIYVDANAIINPKRPDCNYPFKKLCGAGVAYKLIEALYEKNNKGSIYEYIQYVAFATICDVVDLVGENRIFVKYGLEKINETENIGLKALIRESKLENKKISVYHIGFILGPSINASGRIENAEKALSLLLEEDEFEATQMAKELVLLNEERKDMTEKGTERIIEKIENSELKNDSVLVIYDPEIHESIAGIIAGRVKDKFYKPTIVLTDGKDGIKGSARSIEEFNIFEELTKRKKYLNRFGGHPMAAGLSLDLENLEEFRIELNKNNLTKEDLIKKVYIDLPIRVGDINYNLIREISKLEPYGKGNSRPIFGDRKVRIISGRILGKNKNVLKLVLMDVNGNTIEGLLFNDVDKFKEDLISKYGKESFENILLGFKNPVELDLIYYPTLNEFNGRTTLEIIIESYRF